MKLFLRGTVGFDNSLSFDEKGHASAKAVRIAEYARKTAGIAGAAPTQTDGVWEIGIDVAPEFRKAETGLGNLYNLRQGEKADEKTGNTWRHGTGINSALL